MTDHPRGIRRRISSNAKKYTVTEDRTPSDTDGGFYSDNLRSSAVLDSFNFTNDKYKNDDNEPPDVFAPPPRTPGHATPPQDMGGGGPCARNLRTRDLILIIIGCVLLIGVAIGTALAIILTQSDASSPSTSSPTVIPSTSPSPSAENISYNGTLQLAQQWEGTEKDLETNFTTEMDDILQNTRLKETYLKSDFQNYSPEQSLVAFALFFTSGLYHEPVPTVGPDVKDRYGVYIETELRESAEKYEGDIGIKADSIEIIEHIPSTTASPSSSPSPSPVSESTSVPSTTTQTSTTLPPTHCTALAYEQCLSVGYNNTYFPNMYGHITESDAIPFFDTLAQSTVDSGCSPLAMFYYCGLVFPECHPVHQFIYPCSDVCEAVNRDCTNNLRLNCTFFDNGKPCLHGPSTTAPTSTSTTTSTPTPTTTSTPTPTTTPAYTCSALTVEKCRTVGYNVTFLPNKMLHTTMEDAVEGFGYLPDNLINSNCSDLATFYLCGLYFPECSGDGSPLYPCKSVCEEIKSSCGTSVAFFGCNFHDQYDSCKMPPPTTTSTTTTTTTTTPKPYTCNTLDHEICNYVGYNETYLPNVLIPKYLILSSIEQAMDYFGQIPLSLIHAECSPLTEFYFCGLIFPKCGVDGQRLQPCRNVCKEIVSDCSKSVSLFDCDTMFKETDCLSAPDDLPPRLTSTTTTTTTTTPTTTTKPPDMCTALTFSPCSALGYNKTFFPNVFHDNTTASAMSNFDYYAKSSLANNCSSIALEFFCGILFPECEESTDFKVKFPCPDFCTTVMGDCGSYLPFPIDCSFFDREEGCVDAPVIPTTPAPAEQCVNQTFGYCREEGFVSTYLPNWFSDTIPGTIAAFNAYAQSTIDKECSSLAKFFYCGMFFPKCEGNGNWTLLCRDICEEMTVKCGAVWNFTMDCRAFPNNTDNCIAAPVKEETTSIAPVTPSRSPDRCERSTYDVCKVFGFNTTFLPDGWAYETQHEAFKAYEAYGERPVALGCTQNALFYFCTVLFPPCDTGVKKKPCRDICEDVNTHCRSTGLFPQDCSILSDSNEATCLRPQPKTACGSDQFACFGTNRCVPKSSRCDKRNDCGDWSDEKNCPACSEFDFRCEMGFCIKSYQRCDGMLDCPDLSDEIDCNCTNGQYTCSDGKCIMSEWVCDGEYDCSKGEDERNCGSCQASQFACLSGECIPIAQHCDGTPDCRDHSDERACIFQPSGNNPFMLKFEQEGLLPVCYASFNDTLATKACQKLGHKGFETWTKEEYPVFDYAHPDGTGPETTVIGRASIRNTCPDSSAVVLKCIPKECGNPVLSLVSFIVNGNNAGRGAWPWQVSLQRKNKHFCGGSLISPNFVLTAAHCVEAYLIKPQAVQVVLGATNVTANESSQQHFQAKSFTIHDHIYHVKNDIALIELNGTVTYTDLIRPICLPDTDDVFSKSTQCYAAGWGMTRADGPPSQWLQQAKMTLWNTDKCNGSYAWNGVISETHVCAGYYSGLISACVGDSGGPLMCQTNENTWKLVGVASYVAKGCNVPARPTVFSDVAVFKQWIEEKINCKFQCRNGNCIFNRDQLCDRNNDCGDNSDEIDLCDVSVNCTFDDKFMCGYSSQWYLRVQSDYNNHYPLYDHTNGGYPGTFMIAKRQGKLLTSPRFTINTTHCASFYYHMRGEVTFGFQIWTHMFLGNGNDDWKHVFVRDKYVGEDKWIRGEFDLAPHTYEIVFMANENAIVAVDDFMLVPGTCADNGCPSDMASCSSGLTQQCVRHDMLCNMVADCDKGEDEAQCPGGSNFMCDFENGLLCGFRQSSQDDTLTEWRMMNSSTLRRDITDNTYRNRSGVMLILETNYLLEEQEVGMHQDLVLHQPKSCLQFYYFSNTTGSMQINYTRNGSSVSNMIWNIKDRWTRRWAKTQVTIPVSGSIRLDYTVIGGMYDGTYKPFIAIDDVQITPGACSAFECEEGLMPCATENYCLQSNNFCDRVVDCNDASDEAGCECTADEYDCPDGPCIPKSKTCDRKQDCLDGSDEAEVCLHLVSVSCDFEDDFICGYKVNTSTYMWARHVGETTTHNTGPRTDHTFANYTGHYIYADGTDGLAFANSTLESPSFSSNSFGVAFHYHIYSAFHFGHKELGNLTVFARDNTNNQVTELFHAIADGSQNWKYACVSPPISQNVTLLFVAEKGNQVQADVALDDIRRLTRTCEEEAETMTTTIAPVTTATTVRSTGCEDPNYRMCNDGLQSCIPAEYFCDKYPYDCPDNSDEHNCP